MSIFKPFLASLFNKEPEVIAYATTQARTICLFYFLLAFSHCIAAICRGAGKAIVPMGIMLLIWCVGRVIYITIALKIKNDIIIIFTAYPLTWGISSIIYFIYYNFCDWTKGFEGKKSRSKHLEKYLETKNSKNQNKKNSLNSVNNFAKCPKKI